MLLYILCIYLSIYLFILMFILLLLVHIIVLVFPRWVLDHHLGFVWEVPLGGGNPIPPRHLGILLWLFFNLCHLIYFQAIPSPFNLCHPIYFQPIPIFYFMSSHLISCTSPLPLYFIARMRARAHKHTYIICILYLDT